MRRLYFLLFLSFIHINSSLNAMELAKQDAQLIGGALSVQNVVSYQHAAQSFLDKITLNPQAGATPVDELEKGMQASSIKTKVASLCRLVSDRNLTIEQLRLALQQKDSEISRMHKQEELFLSKWKHIGEFAAYYTIDKTSAEAEFTFVKTVEQSPLSPEDQAKIWLCLGECYLWAYGTDENYSAAFDYFTKVAADEQKECLEAKAKAWAALAYCYDFGYGVRKKS